MSFDEICGVPGRRWALPIRMSPTFSFFACKKENVPDTVQKKKRLGMSWPLRRPTHPKRGARRHGLPRRPGTHLPAAPKHTIYNRCVPASGGMALAGGASLKGFPQQPRAFRFATHYPVLRMSRSGSGKRSKMCPICTPRSAVLSSRRAELDALRTPPVPRRDKQVFEQNS